MAFLRSPATADRYGLTVGWLNKSRVRGGDDVPPFMKIRGVVLYDTDVLDKWFAAQARRSTSDQPRPTEPAPRPAAPTRKAPKPRRTAAPLALPQG
jgi:hypothetical protein